MSLVPNVTLANTSVAASSLVPSAATTTFQKASHIPTGSFGVQSFGDELTVLDDSQMVKRSDAGDGPKAPRPFWDSAREAKWRNGYGRTLATAVRKYSEICPTNAGEVKGAILKANKTRLCDDIAEAELAINSMVTEQCAGWTLEHQRRAEAYTQGFYSDWYALPMNMNGVQYVIYPFSDGSRFNEGD